MRGIVSRKSVDGGPASDIGSVWRRTYTTSERIRPSVGEGTHDTNVHGRSLEVFCSSWPMTFCSLQFMGFTSDVRHVTIGGWNTTLQLRKDCEFRCLRQESRCGNNCQKVDGKISIWLVSPLWWKSKSRCTHSAPENKCSHIDRFSHSVSAAIHQGCGSEVWSRGQFVIRFNSYLGPCSSKSNN